MSDMAIAPCTWPYKIYDCSPSIPDELLAVNQRGILDPRGDCPLLNMDVLLNVLENVQGRVHIWCLMKTCRTLYFHGMSILLRDKIWVDEQDQLPPLWRFLSFEFKKSNRFQYLRSLAFCNLGDDNKAISIAVKILKYATNLEYLEFEDGIPLSSPKAFRAVIGLCRLRSVDITSSSPAGIRWLKHTKSPISKVTIDDCGSEIISMSVLVNLATHLTTLELDVDEIAMSNACFPHLRSLKLKVLGPIPASKLVSAFPNLVNVDITMHDTSWPDFPSDDEARGIHESNAADLASSSLSLPPLKFLTAHPYDLYLSAFTPKADWFGTYEKLRPDGQVQTVLRKILPAIRPSVLRLPIFFEPERLSPFPSLKSFIPFISTMTSLKMLRLGLCHLGDAHIEHVIRIFASHFPLEDVSFKQLHLIIKVGPIIDDQVLHKIGLEISLFGIRLSVAAPTVRRLTFSVQQDNDYCGSQRQKFSINLGKCRKQWCMTHKSLMEIIEKI